jgi:Uma2 family endonuclease
VLNSEPISAEEYLGRERAETEERHEFIDGWVIQVSGASLEHNIIVSNLNRTLGTQLRDTDCRAVTNDLRVALPSADKYAYPDVVVYCGEPEIDENHLDMLYNPKVVIETLSPSTMDYDRGEKFARYRQLDALPEIPPRRTGPAPRGALRPAGRPQLALHRHRRARPENHLSLA